MLRCTKIFEAASKLHKPMPFLAMVLAEGEPNFRS
ncbi:hypothetical protein CLV41_110151 [Roseibium marinum]|uniref:Uncharacterized protein n=1 Tax=Roseibium marinum TaxID=281252 RepID=A0A2S3UN55_9HYPH|nr:hypothetical protein CLV41_110151 [Roseibium marinum]